MLAVRISSAVNLIEGSRSINGRPKELLRQHFYKTSSKLYATCKNLYPLKLHEYEYGSGPTRPVSMPRDNLINHFKKPHPMITFTLSLTMTKSNVVLYPSPGKGHLASMVEFGKHLLRHHSNSFSVTVITTVPAPSLSAANPNLSFLLLPALDDAAVSGPPLGLVRLQNPNLRLALLSIPNVAAFVADFFCNAAVDVTAELRIKTYFYFTSGANGLALFLHLPVRDQAFPGGLVALGGRELTLPGLPPIPASEIPAAMADPGHMFHELFLEISAAMAGSDGIMVNTWSAFEGRAVGAIAAGECIPGGITPPVLCIGPMVSSGGGDNGGEERHECLLWLDSQPSQSVLFLSFGSMGSFPREQLAEMAVALERSGVRFLWVVRSPPPPTGQDQGQAPLRVFGGPDPDLDLDSILPRGFVDRTRGRGHVVNTWAPQVQVLSHGSTGGFVTHCGWNSTLEGVCAGVPMLAWPLYAEQKINRFFLVEEAKAALTVTMSEEGFVSAAELEERIVELMKSEKGMALRERVKELRESAMAALGEGGSSRAALAELAESFLRS